MKKLGVLFCFIIGVCLFFNVAAAQNIVLKAMAVNPSTTKAQEVVVKFDLPKEVMPGDIVEIGNFDLRYNFETSSYYLYQKPKLAPGVKQVYEVVIKDIWLIPPPELDKFKEHTETIGALLSKTKYRDTSKELAAAVNKQLSEIIKKQNDRTVTTKKHIDAYYENMIALEDVKYNIGMMEKFIASLGDILEEKVGTKLATGAMSIPQGEISESAQRITLNIEADNPSSKTKKVSVRYPFPKEVMPGHIIDKGGLEIGYDFKLETYYAYAEDVELSPKEKKKYGIVISDIWIIPEEKLVSLEKHSSKLVDIIRGTIFFDKGGNLYDLIQKNIEEIKTTQELGTVEKQGVVGHIGVYRDNNKLLALAEDYVNQLEGLVADMGGKPGITIVSKREGQGTKEITGERERFPGERGLKVIAETIFRGKAPSLSTTWRIVYSIIAFLALLSGIFFFYQHAEQRKGMIDPLTGVFSREYLLERFREELRIANKTNRKCSLLMMDIDKFKNINDEYGHIVGDTVLKEFIIALRKSVRATDLVGRYGGDEFLIILPTMTKDRAQKVAENIRKIVLDHKIRVQDKTLQVTTSVGVVAYPDDSFTMEDLINKVDAALYECKNKGGNSITVYSGQEFLTA